MIYMICDFYSWNVLYFPAISLPRAFKKATEKGLRHFSFSDVFRTSWDIEDSTEHHTNTGMDGKTRVSRRAPQSQPFLGNASSFLKSFYKNPVRWYVYVHFLIFVFFYSQYIFCQSACGRRKHDEKNANQKKEPIPARL